MKAQYFFLQPVLILLVLLAVFLVSRSAKKWRRPVSIPRRALWKRISGAVIGFAALATITLGTWRSVGTPLARGSDSVVRPTMPAPVPKADEPGGYSTASVEPCQMILRVYLLRNHKTAPVILHGKSIVLNWPKDAGRIRDLEFTPNGVLYFISLSVDRIYVADGRISLNGSRSLRVETRSGSRSASRSSGGGIAYLGMGDILNDSSSYPVASHDPLSLWPRVSEDLAVWVEAELASKDDPLREVPIAQVKLAPGHEPTFMGMTGPVFGSIRRPPGIAMIAHWGPASLLVLLAAAAGAYAFRRSGPAFAVLLAGCILYVGGLERLLIHRIGQMAGDSTRPLPERLAVVDQLRDVFFHPDASMAEMQAIADDAALPGEIRQRAAEIGMSAHEKD